MHKFQGYIPECQTHRETTVWSQGATPVDVPLITHWLAVIDTAGTKGPFVSKHLDGSVKGADACVDRPGIQRAEWLQVVYLSLELCDFAKSLVSVWIFGATKGPRLAPHFIFLSSSFLTILLGPMQKNSEFEISVSTAALLRFCMYQVRSRTPRLCRPLARTPHFQTRTSRTSYYQALHQFSDIPIFHLQGCPLQRLHITLPATTS